MTSQGWGTASTARFRVTQGTPRPCKGPGAEKQPLCAPDLASPAHLEASADVVSWKIHLEAQGSPCTVPTTWPSQTQNTTSGGFLADSNLTGTSAKMAGATRRDAAGTSAE